MDCNNGRRRQQKNGKQKKAKNRKRKHEEINEDSEPGKWVRYVTKNIQ